MVRRCFPVAKIAGSSPVWVVYILNFSSTMTNFCSRRSIVVVLSLCCVVPAVSDRDASATEGHGLTGRGKRTQSCTRYSG